MRCGAIGWVNVRAEVTGSVSVGGGRVTRNVSVRVSYCEDYK